jgi:tetratricopeptide (TPR) repeat protein
MGVRRGQVLVAVASLLWLGGCETSTKLGDFIQSKNPDDLQATASLPPAPGLATSSGADPATTGSVPGPDGQKPAPPGLLGSDPQDELSLGKKQYRAGNYGLAELHFRRAVEQHPRDAEAWVGLAACYDRLKKFDLADRAYRQVVTLIGPTPEVLNNQGYSYILRGDYRRARATLMAARIKDPSNPYIQNNIELLEKSERRHKSVQ